MTNASLAEEVEELVAVSLDEYDSGDATWILTSAFIILTMQSGFGLLETGMVSARNEVNIMMKNVDDVVIGGLVYGAYEIRRARAPLSRRSQGALINTPTARRQRLDTD